MNYSKLFIILGWISMSLIASHHLCYCGTHNDKRTHISDTSCNDNLKFVGLINNEYLFNNGQNTPDTLRFTDVSLDASWVKYEENPEDFTKNVYCRVLLYKDSIAKVMYFPDSEDYSVSTYCLTNANKEKIESLAADIISIKEDPLIACSYPTRKLSGSLTIYPTSRTKDINNKGIGKLVDSLYMYLCDLVHELDKVVPSKILQNPVVSVSPVHLKGSKNQTEKRNLLVDFDSYKILVEGNQIIWCDPVGRKKKAELTSKDRDTIYNLFDDKVFFFNNSISPNIRHETESSYLIMLNDFYLFHSQFPGANSLSLYETDLLPEKKYIMKMYKLIQIAEKYFPDLLHDQLQLSDNGTKLIQQ